VPTAATDLTIIITLEILSRVKKNISFFCYNFFTSRVLNDRQIKTEQRDAFSLSLFKRY